MKFWTLFLLSFVFTLSIFAQQATPTVTLTADNENLPYGESTYIRWNSTNATSCVGLNFNTKNATSGVYHTGVLTSTTTFRITATNNSGVIATASITINTATPAIIIQKRIAGAGTNISVPVIVNINGEIPIEGFQFFVEKDKYVKPNYFNLGYVFQNKSWTYACNPNYTGFIEVAAVGNKINLKSGDVIGEINLHVNEDISAETWFTNFYLFDGGTTWASGSDQLKILDIPFKSYGNLLNDHLLNIQDGIISWKLCGTIPTNDTVKIIADLNGDGLLTSWDTNLLLSKIVDPTYTWPIFSNYNGPVYGNMTTPMTATWQKMVNGKWGLFSKEPITNGDLAGQNISGISSPNGMFKKVDDKVYFAGQNAVVNTPILIADYPVALTGTVNEGRKIQISTSVTDVIEETILPKEFSLTQNYPNPFNPSTTIAYTLPSAGHVTLKVYNVLGEEVATLINKTKAAGTYEAKFDAKNLASGTYVYRISAGNFTQIKKMILMK